MTWFMKKTRIDSIQHNLQLTELIKRTRIVVIDDNPEAFPAKFFRDQGYSVDFWLDVQDMTKLENGFYDIIILDIGGVGKLVDAQDGTGVLDYLKRKSPQQIVVAYSGQSSSPDKIQFFRMADEYIAKPASALSIKEVLDRLIVESISVKRYWLAIEQVLQNQGVSDKSIAKLETTVVAAFRNKDRNSKQIAMSALGGIDRLSTIISLIDKLLALAI